MLTMLSRCSQDVVKMSCQKPKYYLKFVPMKIGHKIKELRLKGGYSQKDLSIKSGLSERTIQRIEKDEVTPNPHTLKVLGEIFEENFHQFENGKSSINSEFVSLVRWINFNFFGNSSKSILSILGWILFFVGLWWLNQ